MITKIIKSRRSISKFLDKNIDLKVIDEIIELSSYAPSSCNTQPWYFLVFSSKESKEKLNIFIDEGYKETKNDILKNHKMLGLVYSKILTFFEKYGKFDNAPIYILVFGKPYDTPLFSQAINFAKNEQIEKISKESVKTSVSMAMQNFLLIAHNKGLGTRVKDGIKFLINFEELKKKFYNEFKIPLEYELISGIQIGYPDKSIVLKEKSRLNIEKIRKFV